MDISFLIVSLDDCLRQINFLNKIKIDYSYEILIASPKKISCENNIEYKIFEDTGSSVSCYNNLYKNSTGKFIVCLTGVTLPPANINDLIKKMEIEYNNGTDFIIKSPCDENNHSFVIPRWARYAAGLSGRGKNAPQIIRYPLFLRDTIDKYLDGVIFAESFIHHYCDNWLGTYCALIGKKVCEETEFKITNLPHESIKKNDFYDKIVYENLCKNFAKHKKYNIKV
tara:strand:- start:4198 stop:4875 length:678 start_codon:yes stop_codon:yes gene_type:complete